MPFITITLKNVILRVTESFISYNPGLIMLSSLAKKHYQLILEDSLTDPLSMGKKSQIKFKVLFP